MESPKKNNYEAMKLNYYYLLMVAASIFVFDVLTTNFLPYGALYFISQIFGFTSFSVVILFVLSAVSWVCSLWKSRWQMVLFILSTFCFNLSFFLYLNENSQPTRYISSMHFFFYISLTPWL